MALRFNESTDYISIADSATLSTTTDDWCVGIWSCVTDNSGSLYQYLVSNNSYYAANSLNLNLQETDLGGPADDCWRCFLADGDTTQIDLTASVSTGGDDVWRLIVITHNASASRMEMWFVTQDGTPTRTASFADTNFGAINSGSWCIGRRTDGNAARYYGGDACEFFKGDFYLTVDEMRLLGTGKTIAQIGREPAVYHPMLVNDATFVDMFGTNNASPSGSPTAIPHPPIGGHMTGMEYW